MSETSADFAKHIFDENFAPGTIFTHKGRTWITKLFLGTLRGADTQGYRAVEQNPLTGSEYAKRAKSGEQIIWFFDTTPTTRSRYSTNYTGIYENGAYRSLHKEKDKQVVQANDTASKSP